MIERLDQLTLQDLIEVSCGNIKPLGCEDELEGIKLANRLVSEYLFIAQPTRAKMHLVESEDIAKLVMREKCLKILKLLCDLGHPEKAKEILLDLGVSESHLKDNEAIALRCKAMLDDVRFELRRAQEAKEENPMPNQSPEQLRKGWYSEIAFVMSTLKMSFDPGTMNAAVYANLVHQAVERSKQLAKMPQMGMFF